MPRDWVDVVKIGDKVRVIGLPEDYLKDAPADAVDAFQKSLGGTFVIESFNEIGWVEIVIPKSESSSDTIWLNRENVELVEVW